MTAIRIQRKTLLNFSNQKLNRHRITQALRQVTPLVSNENVKPWLRCDNDIIIGMYVLRLYTAEHMKSLSARKWKTFGFSIYEKTTRGERILNLQTHNLFKDQYWSKYDVLGHGGATIGPGMTTKDLTNIIMHCSRLDKLKAFS